jgi:hypothetical protein
VYISLPKTLIVFFRIFVAWTTFYAIGVVTFNSNWTAYTDIAVATSARLDREPNYDVSSATTVLILLRDIDDSSCSAGSVISASPVFGPVHNGRR